MKKVMPLILLLLFVWSCTNTEQDVSSKVVVKQLENLVEVQDYFKLKSTFESNRKKLSKVHSLYYGAIIDNVFNQPEASNKAISTLLATCLSQLNDTLLNKLYRTKLLNDVNLFEYREASETSYYIQEHFLHLTDSSDREMLANEVKIWSALNDVPRQQLIKKSDCSIPMLKDKVGLFNVDVKMGDSTINLLFDTGANFSALKRSMVHKLGLEFIEADFLVTAATGLKVSCNLAVADALSFGGMTFKNVVFLVINDEDLSFPQIDYYPNGAIGFPVIEAMEEIRINKENQIFVPQHPVAYTFNNFALDGMMPILAAAYQGDTLRFHFDTGATRTSLYPQFYKDYKDQVEKDNEKIMLRSGSGGGIVEFEGYRINDVELRVADSHCLLQGLQLHIHNIGNEESNFHGNFGQDYIRQFDQMIISFKYASVLFKGAAAN